MRFEYSTGVFDKDNITEIISKLNEQGSPRLDLIDKEYWPLVRTWILDNIHNLSDEEKISYIEEFALHHAVSESDLRTLISTLDKYSFGDIGVYLVRNVGFGKYDQVVRDLWRDIPSDDRNRVIEESINKLDRESIIALSPFIKFKKNRSGSYEGVSHYVFSSYFNDFNFIREVLELTISEYEKGNMSTSYDLSNTPIGYYYSMIPSALFPYLYRLNKIRNIGTFDKSTTTDLFSIDASLVDLPEGASEYGSQYGFSRIILNKDDESEMSKIWSEIKEKGDDCLNVNWRKKAPKNLYRKIHVLSENKAEELSKIHFANFSKNRKFLNSSLAEYLAGVRLPALYALGEMELTKEEINDLFRKLKENYDYISILFGLDFRGLKYLKEYNEKNPGNPDLFSIAIDEFIKNAREDFTEERELHGFLLHYDSISGWMDPETIERMIPVILDVVPEAFLGYPEIFKKHLNISAEDFFERIKSRELEGNLSLSITQRYKMLERFVGEVYPDDFEDIIKDIQFFIKEMVNDNFSHFINLFDSGDVGIFMSEEEQTEYVKSKLMLGSTRERINAFVSIASNAALAEKHKDYIREMLLETDLMKVISSEEQMYINVSLVLEFLDIKDLIFLLKKYEDVSSFITLMRYNGYLLLGMYFEDPDFMENFFLNIGKSSAYDAIKLFDKVDILYISYKRKLAVENQKSPKEKISIDSQIQIIDKKIAVLKSKLKKLKSIELKVELQVLIRERKVLERRKVEKENEFYVGLSEKERFDNTRIIRNHAIEAALKACDLNPGLFIRSELYEKISRDQEYSSESDRLFARDISDVLYWYPELFFDPDILRRVLKDNSLWDKVYDSHIRKIAYFATGDQAHYLNEQSYEYRKLMDREKAFYAAIEKVKFSPYFKLLDRHIIRPENDDDFFDKNQRTFTLIGILDKTKKINASRVYELSSQLDREELFEFLEDLAFVSSYGREEFVDPEDFYDIRKYRESLANERIRLQLHLLGIDNVNLKEGGGVLNESTLGSIKKYKNTKVEQKKKDLMPLLNEVVNHHLKGDFAEWRMWGSGFESLKEDNLIPEKTNYTQYKVWTETRRVSVEQELGLGFEDIEESIEDILRQSRENVHISDNSLSRGLGEIQMSYFDLVSPLQDIVDKQRKLRAIIKSKRKEDVTEDERTLLDSFKREVFDYLESNKTKLQRHKALIYIKRLEEISFKELEGGYIKTIGEDRVPFSQMFKEIREAFGGEVDFMDDINRIESTLLSGRRELFGDGIVSKQKLFITDAVDFETYFKIGEEPVKSCQSYDNGTYSEALLSYVADPNVKIVQVKDESGLIISRAILRLLENGDGEPALFIEEIYTNNQHRKIKELIYRFAVDKANEMGVNLYSKVDLDDSYKIVSTKTKKTLSSKGSRNRYVYTDASGGLVDNGIFKIKNVVELEKSN